MGSPLNQLQSVSETVRAGVQSELLSQGTPLVWHETEHTLERQNEHWLYRKSTQLLTYFD